MKRGQMLLLSQESCKNVNVRSVVSLFPLRKYLLLLFYIPYTV